MVSIDLWSQRHNSQSRNGIVHLSMPMVVIPQVLELVVCVVRCVTHIMHGCCVHLGAVDGESASHAHVRFRFAAHDDMDIFGRGPASISKDVDGDVCESTVTNVPGWSGGVVPVDPPGVHSWAPSPSAGASATVICRARPSSSDTIQYHCGDHVVGSFIVFFVDARGRADEGLPFFVVC